MSVTIGHFKSVDVKHTECAVRLRCVRPKWFCLSARSHLRVSLWDARCCVLCKHERSDSTWNGSPTTYASRQKSLFSAESSCKLLLVTCRTSNYENLHGLTSTVQTS